MDFIRNRGVLTAIALAINSMSITKVHHVYLRSVLRRNKVLQSMMRELSYRFLGTCKSCRVLLQIEQMGARMEPQQVL